MDKIKDLVTNTNGFSGWAGLDNKMVLFRFLELNVVLENGIDEGGSLITMDDIKIYRSYQLQTV